jgi:hypothetical protein
VAFERRKREQRQGNDAAEKMKAGGTNATNGRPFRVALRCVSLK